MLIVSSRFQHQDKPEPPPEGRLPDAGKGAYIRNNFDAITFKESSMLNGLSLFFQVVTIWGMFSTRWVSVTRTSLLYLVATLWSVSILNLLACVFQSFFIILLTFPIWGPGYSFVGKSSQGAIWIWRCLDSKSSCLRQLLFQVSFARFLIQINFDNIWRFLSEF